VEEKLEAEKAEDEAAEPVAAPELSLGEINALITFGAFAVSLRDCMAFMLAIKGFSINIMNVRCFVACSILDIVMEMSDRFYNIGIVAKIFVELVHFIVHQQGDFNVMTLKAPGIYGRLRRAKQLF